MVSSLLEVKSKKKSEKMQENAWLNSFLFESNGFSKAKFDKGL